MIKVYDNLRDFQIRVMMTRNKLQGNFGAIISQSKDILNIQTAQIIHVVLYVNHVCGDFNVLKFIQPPSLN